MSIEPFIKCSEIKASLAFYTQVMDFNIRQAPDPDPESFMSMYSFLEREGSFVHLSSHFGDGAFGNVIFLRVDDIDVLYEKFIKNGLHEKNVTIKPIDQTWGMKEFAVVDPDGNRITFGHKI